MVVRSSLPASMVALVLGVLLLAAPCVVRAIEYPDQGAAFAGCSSTGASAGGDKSRKATGNYRCSQSPGRYACQYEVKPYENEVPYFITCGNWVPGGGEHDYPADKGCDSRPSKVTPFFPPAGSTRCMDGCEVSYRDNGDDTTTYSPTGKLCDKKPDCTAGGKNMVWNGMLGVCQPVEPECPEGKVKVGNTCANENPCPDGMALVAGSCKKKDEECPSGMIRSPSGQCIPGDGSCAAGEVRGPDGTCKRDKDNDGEPDPAGPDDKDSFSGGDTCSSPPSCSGSPIMCGQARIQWRIDCNTRRNNNISGGHCSQAGMPTCTGEKCNAMEYAGLLMQWRSACALEKLAAGKAETPGNNSDANGNGVPDVLEGSGDPAPIGDSATDVQGAKKWGIGVSTGLLDTSNMFGGGSCPTPPTFKLMGQTISGADFPYFCQAAAILRGLIQIFAAFVALKILMGWGF
jgi:hypothetical protein